MAPVHFLECHLGHPSHHWRFVHVGDGDDDHYGIAVRDVSAWSVWGSPAGSVALTVTV